VIFVIWSGGEGGDGHLLGVRGGGVGNGSDAATGEDVEAEVAAAFGPFVVLFGEDGADQADEGVAVGEMPTTSVRRRISRLRRSLRRCICR
jgi:hypothetical protein